MPGKAGQAPFEERQDGAEEALQHLEDAISEIRDAQKLIGESNLSVEAAAAAWLLERLGVADAEAVAREVDTCLDEHPHWRTSALQEQGLRNQLYAALSRADVGNPRSVVDIGQRLLDMLRGASQ